MILWRFSRPHTVVGTVLSILGLYAIARHLHAQGETSAVQLGMTLLAGIGVNVFIVGLNQLEDVEIDRINKPSLPIAAGELSPAAARVVVAIAATIALGLALTQGVVESVAVLVALAVGAAYSSPPLRLKRFPVAASASITLVRALVVNLGVYEHFSGSLRDIPDSVWALTLFVAPFAFAIAILKDVPDAEGDRRFRIRTFTVRAGGRRVLAAGVAALTLAYLGMAVLGPVLVEEAHGGLLAASHFAVLAVLLRWARAVDPDDRAAFTRFYMRIWGLFFLEYALVPLAVLAG